MFGCCVWWIFCNHSTVTRLFSTNSHVTSNLQKVSHVLVGLLMQRTSCQLLLSCKTFWSPLVVLLSLIVGYAEYQEAYNFAQQTGVFEVRRSDSVTHRKVLRQVVLHAPIHWCPIVLTQPVGIIGNYHWCVVYFSRVEGWVCVKTVGVIDLFCLHCFDAVGWAAGRASGL